MDRYVESKIKAALSETGGSRQDAMRKIAEAAQHDERLLRGLAQPHFQGLVAYATDRVMRKFGIENRGTRHKPSGQEAPARPAGADRQPERLDERTTEKVLARLRRRAQATAGGETAEPDPAPSAGQRKSRQGDPAKARPRGQDGRTKESAPSGRGKGGARQAATAAASAGRARSEGVSQRAEATGQEQGLAAVIAEAKQQAGLGGQATPFGANGGTAREGTEAQQAAGKRHVHSLRSLAEAQRKQRSTSR